MAFSNRNSARHADLNYGTPLYSEKIRWPLWLWAFILFLSASIDLAIWAALSSTATILTTVASIALIIYANQMTTLRITVTKGWFLVGPAAIERAFIHNFRALDSKAMREVRGVGADPACYLELRFWVPTGLKLELRDPKDKTPYWLISTNRANELLKILNLADH
jgi:hypothetical protein